MNTKSNDDDSNSVPAMPTLADPARPSKTIIVAFLILGMISLVLIGAPEWVRAWISGQLDIFRVARDAGTALLVGGVIALIFELVIQQQANKAAARTFTAVFRPVRQELERTREQLVHVMQKTERTMQLAHVMAVADHLGIQDIFRNRQELFEQELKGRLLQDDIRALFLVGVSLRDFFAADAPLYSVMTEINEQNKRKESDDRVEIHAVIMQGDCEDANLRIEVEEGTEFVNAQKAAASINWREKSRLWSDYRRVTDCLGLHFDQVQAREFSHLPTSWVALIESRTPHRCAVYIEQYHYGRIESEGSFYSCLGGKYPILKFGPGSVYEIFHNHVETMVRVSGQKNGCQPRADIGS